MKTALIVIDVQKYFVNEETKNLPQRIGNFIEKSSFDYVLFTQLINSKDSNFVRLLNWNKCFKSPDIDIHPLLLRFITKGNLFQKTSFSIFKSRKLTEFLKKHNITKLLLCGIDTESCILASAFDAFDQGYDVRVLEDLSFSHSGRDFHDAAIKILNKNIQKQKF